MKYLHLYYIPLSLAVLFLLQVAFFLFESRLEGTSQVRNLFPSETRSVRPLEGKTRTLDGRAVRV